MTQQEQETIIFNEKVLEILRAFEYKTAFIGNDLSKIRQGSYIPYGDITAKIGELDNEIKTINKKYSNKRH